MASEVKHTPGLKVLVRITHCADCGADTTVTKSTHECRQQRAANRRASKICTACRHPKADHDDQGCHGYGCGCLARAAIAKATGGES